MSNNLGSLVKPQPTIGEALLKTSPVEPPEERQHPEAGPEIEAMKNELYARASAIRGQAMALQREGSELNRRADDLSHIAQYGENAEVMKQKLDELARVSDPLGDVRGIVQRLRDRAKMVTNATKRHAEAVKRLEEYAAKNPFQPLAIQRLSNAVTAAAEAIGNARMRYDSAIREFTDFNENTRRNLDGAVLQATARRDQIGGELDILADDFKTTRKQTDQQVEDALVGIREPGAHAAQVALVLPGSSGS